MLKNGGWATILGRPNSRAVLLALGLLVAALATHCGGGGNNGSPPPAVSVFIINPLPPVTVTAGNSQQFRANVTGTTNTAVNWSVTGTGANLGTITSGGLYTAPNPPPTPNAVTVKATSQADPNKSASLLVTINAAPPPVAKQTVTVTAGNTTSNVNIAVQPLTPTIQLIAAGTGNSGGVTGAAVSRSTVPTPTLFLAGNGVVAGTTFQISGPNDVQVTQPGPGDFCMTLPPNPLPCVNLSISVSSTAAFGPRNIMVTNSNGELAVFVGGLLVTP